MNYFSSPFKKKYNRFRKPWTRSLVGQSRSPAKDDDASDDDEDEHEKLRTKIRTNIIKHVVKAIMKNNSMSAAEESQLQMAAEIINNITYYLDDVCFRLQFNIAS